MPALMLNDDPLGVIGVGLSELAKLLLLLLRFLDPDIFLLSLFSLSSLLDDVLEGEDVLSPGTASCVDFPC